MNLSLRAPRRPTLPPLPPLREGEREREGSPPRRVGLQSTLQSPNNDVPTLVPGDTLDQDLSDMQNPLQAESTP
jgi:hypothetical protein